MNSKIIPSHRGFRNALYFFKTLFLRNPDAERLLHYNSATLNFKVWLLNKYMLAFCYELHCIFLQTTLPGFTERQFDG